MFADDRCDRFEPSGALQSVTKLLASPETHLTSLPARLCALGCVAAVVAWRLPVDNRRSLSVPVHPVVRAWRAREPSHDNIKQRQKQSQGKIRKSKDKKQRQRKS